MNRSAIPELTKTGEATDIREETVAVWFVGIKVPLWNGTCLPRGSVIGRFHFVQIFRSFLQVFGE
jgi:hypothetical protein